MSRRDWRDITADCKYDSIGGEEAEHSMTDFNLVFARPRATEHARDGLGGIIDSNDIHLPIIGWIRHISGIYWEIMFVERVWKVSLQRDVDFRLQSWTGRWWAQFKSCHGRCHCGQAEFIRNILIVNAQTHLDCLTCIHTI